MQEVGVACVTLRRLRGPRREERLEARAQRGIRAEIRGASGHRHGEAVPLMRCRNEHFVAALPLSFHFFENVGRGTSETSLRARGDT